ncbi:hypothetical protein BRW65_15295 [Mycobacterium paraffinicum]|uniref:Uncharacterized protein n=1 Tax=Mycobacterium paraffinicum TaxID=53378 RepID=A0A1Q4HTC2_9MYCO|nr:hypothetical protein BRW65_15295 [Mycobacterium paraffinicum]
MVVLGKDEDAGSVVVAADADVVQGADCVQGDGSGLVDAVSAYAVVVSMRVVGSAGVDDCWGSSVR